MERGSKEWVARYYWLCHEIKKQRARLERMADDIDHDTVRGSSPELPYDERLITIIGETGSRKKLQKAIEQAVAEAEVAVVEISDYIDGVADPLMRELLRDRFIERRRWKDIGKRNHMDAEAARRKVWDFFRKK